MALQENQHHNLQRFVDDPRVAAGLIGAFAIGIFHFIQLLRRHQLLWPQRRFQRRPQMRPITPTLPQPCGIAVPPSHDPAEQLLPPPTHKMLPKFKSTLETDLLAQAWTAGRDVIVNDDSNTISVYNVRNIGGKDDAEIPLRHRGIVIVPHSFSRVTSAIAPPPLKPGVDHINRDGFSSDEIQLMVSYITNIIQIDFYLDREVIITLSSEAALLTAVQIIGGMTFVGLGCRVRLRAAGAVKKEHVKGGKDPVDKSTNLQSGSQIFNRAGEYSTLGTFLCRDPRSPTSSIEVDRCTVSAHSFLRKRAIGKEMGIITIVSVLMVIVLSFVGAQAEWLPESIVRGILALRSSLLVYDAIWKYGGRRLGWHKMDRVLKLERHLVTLGYEAIVMLPLLTGHFVCHVITVLLKTYPGWNLSRFFAPVVEFGVTAVWLYWLNFVRGMIGVADHALKQTLYGNELNLAYRFPVGGLFVTCGVLRGIMYTRDLADVGWMFRFAGLSLLFWDVVECIWDQDIPATFQITKEPVIFDQNMIGRVERSFDPYVSRFAPSLCINDIAICKLDAPVFINNFRPLTWLKIIERDHPLFLAGLEKQGVAKAEKRWIAESMEGALGGWRYMIHLTTQGRLPDYQDGAVLLWRSNDLSIRGCSGAMIVTPGEKLDNGYYHEWITVAFQSHEISANVVTEQERGPDCWKVGYQAPAELKTEFRPVMGNQLLHILDMQYSSMKI